jgi:hypothetical protein
MPSIDRLNQSDIAAADAVPFYSAAGGADRRTSVSQLATLLQTLLNTGGGPTQQYAAPNATGFSVTISPAVAGAWVWLLLTPVAGYAAGTIVLPAAPQDRQEVVVNSTQAVTTLTVSGNGATVNGAPSTLAANAFFRMKYDAVLSTWYRIG